MKQQLSFSLEGDFITRFAREQCENGQFMQAMELLLSCMKTPDLSERKLRQMAFSVLNGEARIKGTYPSNDYGFEYLEKTEKSSISECFHHLNSRIEKAESESKRYEDWYTTAMDHVPAYEWDEVLRETGQQIEDVPDIQAAPSVSDSKDLTGELQSYMRRMSDTRRHTTSDYGWLEPNGVFHEANWGEHETYAISIVENHLQIPSEDYDSDILCTTPAGNYLINRGWVLLHNPARGIALITRNEAKRYTKAQKDFLYAYYTERGETEQANAVISDGE